MQQEKNIIMTEEEIMASELEAMEEAEYAASETDVVEDFSTSKPHSRHDRHLYPAIQSSDADRPRKTTKDRRYNPSVKRTDKNKIHGKSKKPYKSEKQKPLP